jgi:hypothetical protein
MTKIRPVRPDDIPAIVELVASVDFPSRSEAGWHWILFENPEQEDVPAGLVAERGGRLEAIVGLQARNFIVEGQSVKVGSGHTFISSRSGRGLGFHVARHALSQPGLAAIYTLNNNAIAGRFHKKIGLSAWLAHEGRAKLYWPVRPLTMMAGAVFSKLSRSDYLYDWLVRREWFDKVPTRPLDQFSAFEGGVRKLDPGAQDADIIDRFGQAICAVAGAAPLRRASTYAYQMADPDAPGRSLCLGIESDGELQALMQLVLAKPNTFEPAELLLADLAFHPDGDSAALLEPLIKTARSLARSSGAARLHLPFAARVPGDALSRTGPRLVRHQTYDSAHAWFAPGHHAMAAHWSPTGYAGDFFFALRSAPSSRAKRHP